MYIYIYIYIYIYTNLPVNVIVRLLHPRSGDSQGPETFLAPSADKQTRNHDKECSNHHPFLSTLRPKGLIRSKMKWWAIYTNLPADVINVKGIESYQDEMVINIYKFWAIYSELNILLRIWLVLTCFYFIKYLILRPFLKGGRVTEV